MLHIRGRHNHTCILMHLNASYLLVFASNVYNVILSSNLNWVTELEKHFKWLKHQVSIFRPPLQIKVSVFIQIPLPRNSILNNSEWNDLFFSSFLSLFCPTIQRTNKFLTNLQSFIKWSSNKFYGTHILYITVVYYNLSPIIKSRPWNINFTTHGN